MLEKRNFLRIGVGVRSGSVAERRRTCRGSHGSPAPDVTAAHNGPRCRLVFFITPQRSASDVLS